MIIYMCVCAYLFIWASFDSYMLNNYQMVTAEIPSKKHQETTFFSWYLAGKPNICNNLEYSIKC